MSDYHTLTILNLMVKTKLKSNDFVKGIEMRIMEGQIIKINSLTNMLYTFAKLNHKVSDGFIPKIASLLEQNHENMSTR